MAAETRVWGDAGYAGRGPRRPGAPGPGGSDWQVALRPGTTAALGAPDSAAAEVEQRKASIRAKVEHPFLYVKRHFGYAQVRYRGLAKNRTRLCLLFGFANLRLAERAAPALSGSRAPCAGDDAALNRTPMTGGSSPRSSAQATDPGTRHERPGAIRVPQLFRGFLGVCAVETWEHRSSR